MSLQNRDFGVLQKSSKHFLISIFFHMGRGDTPLPDPPPAPHFVPRTRASPLSMTIHAPPLRPNPGSATAHYQRYPSHLLAFTDRCSKTISLVATTFR